MSSGVGGVVSCTGVIRAKGGVTLMVCSELERDTSAGRRGGVRTRSGLRSGLEGEARKGESDFRRGGRLRAGMSGIPVEVAAEQELATLIRHLHSARPSLKESVELWRALWRAKDEVEAYSRRKQKAENGWMRICKREGWERGKPLAGPDHQLHRGVGG